MEQENNNTTSLDLSGWYYGKRCTGDDDTLSQQTNLTELMLNVNDRITDKGLIPLTKLTLLELHDNLLITGDYIENQSGITNLAIGGCSAFNYDNLLKLEELRTLCLEDGEHIDENILGQLTNLTHLTISSNELITDQTLSKLTNLTFLEMNYTCNITFAGISTLTKLEEIHLDYNYSMDRKKLSCLSSLKIVKDFEADHPIEIDNNDKDSLKIRKRFIKDMGLPIQVAHEPYFSHGINVIDQHFNSKKKLELLNAMNLSSFHDMIDISTKIMDELVGKIKSTKDYEEWCKQTSVVPKKLEPVYKSVGGKSFYKERNVGKRFISIDLVSANFLGFREYSKDMVLGFSTYYELISSVTEHEYYRQSKHFRQLLFSNLRPSCHARMWQKIIHSIITILLGYGIFGEEDIEFISNDEVVFVLKDDMLQEEVMIKINAIKDALYTESYQDLLKIDAFKLSTIDENTNKKDAYFVKEHIYPCVGKVEFKCIPNHLFLQVYNHYMGTPTDDMDMVFYQGDLLAIYTTPLFSPKL
jgi:hypothetical protein